MITHILANISPDWKTASAGVTELLVYQLQVASHKIPITYIADTLHVAQLYFLGSRHAISNGHFV